MAVLHSSFTDLRPPLAFDRSSAVRGLERLIDDGWTLAIAAFTFSFCGGRPFQRDRARSEVGPLADYALHGLSSARRTNHPIYSFVVAGQQADEILGCAGETTFGAGTPFELFELRAAQMMMIGCGWDSCTQFHLYEELASVPYRYFKSFSGYADFGHGPEEATTSMFVRDLDLDPQNDFSPIERDLRRGTHIAETSLWHGRIGACPVMTLAACTRTLIDRDPFALLSNGEVVAGLLSRRFQRKED